MAGFEDNRPRRVAVYGRVSTEHEAQVSAFENQLEWYQEEMKRHPEWTLAGVYADKGITGTSAQKRPRFMKMIEDAKDKMFDLIITREVSRFARNTVDTLTYVRELKSVGVEVYFIADNIKTFDSDGELRLTIMASIAQEESRKTSERAKKGQQISRKNGTYYGNGNVLGYVRHSIIEDGVKTVSFEIDPEQARTVRKMFDLYLDGKGVRAIKYELESLGYKTATGNTTWHEANISRILQNPFYAGKIRYGVQYVPDFLEQKKINNLGENPVEIVQGTHAPIISQEDFDRVQAGFAAHREELNSMNPDRKNPRQRIFGKKPPSDVWVKLLECECGHRFNRKRWHTKTSGEKQYAYQCYSSVRSGTVKSRENHGLDTEGVCRVPMLQQWKLQMMASHLFYDYLEDTQAIIEFSEKLLQATANSVNEAMEANAEEIAEIDRKIQKLENRINGYSEMRADGDITREIFLKKKAECEAEISSLQKQRSDLLPDDFVEDAFDADYKEKLAILKKALEDCKDFDKERIIPDEVIDAFVVKIVAHEDGLDWYLRFKPDPEDPVKCHVDGDKRKGGKTPTFAYGGTGCPEGLREYRVNCPDAKPVSVFDVNSAIVAEA
jgi:DNA invertase Pin-like site-specific DNA recombinase